MPVNDSSLTEALATLRTEHLQHDELESSLRRVLEVTCALFGVSGAGLMVVDDNATLRYVAATDGRSAALEAAQAETGEGPCVESLLRDEVIHTDDVVHDARWPTLSANIDGLGVGALLGVPIHVGKTSVGSLNVYTDAGSTWKDEEVEALRAFGLVVEEMLAQALTSRQRHVLAEQLDQALSTRVVIDRAVGVVMADHRTDPMTAFNILRSQARAQRRKVVDVANEVLEAVQRPESPILESGPRAMS
jgi:GAF domain-containing protein